MIASVLDSGTGLIRCHLLISLLRNTLSGFLCMFFPYFRFGFLNVFYETMVDSYIAEMYNTDEKNPYLGGVT